MRSIVFGVLLAVVVLVGHPVNATVPATQVPCDFVTGGGFIVGTGNAPPPPATETLAEGAKGTFGVGGGVRNGAFWGHLEYTDHSTSPPLNVHGTGVIGYSGTANTRVIQGTAEVNGTDGFTYTVTVTDNGEPGRGADQFSITVDELGYTAGGILAGGNIQLHKANASTTPPHGFTCQP